MRINGPYKLYGIALGTCDCEGTLPDEGYDCAGQCLTDEDNDGVCDAFDPCVGELDACGVCNGPGATYACGCGDFPEGDCDCNGNELDALGVCGGACLADADADGICDDADECVGFLDACGVCNGPGEIYECGCTEIPEGDCDCNGNQLDASGDCGGACAADVDEDGICDDIDTCVGVLDACDVCNGPGAIFDCGCAEMPEGDCDCDGNEPPTDYDCDGNCILDTDGDGQPDCEATSCAEDLNGNGMIEVSDVLLLLGDFGCTENCAADIDGDGSVGVTDVLLLLAAYGEDC